MTETLLPLSPTADDFAVLLDRLAKRNGFVRLDEGHFDAFAAGSGDRVVLFADDPVRVPETWDVLVVLPELLKSFGHRLQAGVPDVATARHRAQRYGFRVWPALVFLRDGGYVGTIEGMRDWEAYLREVSALLEKPVGRMPGIGIAVRSAATDGSATPGAAP